MKIIIKKCTICNSFYTIKLCLLPVAVFKIPIKGEKIKDVAEKANALLRAEESFDLWMDIYPESETWLDRLEAPKKHDDFMDFLGNNPKNPE